MRRCVRGEDGALYLVPERAIDWHDVLVRLLDARGRKRNRSPRQRNTLSDMATTILRSHRER